MSTAIKSMNDLYVESLRDLYSAETQITKALPKMAKAANSDELKNGFEEHLAQTNGQIERLKQIFQGLGEKPTGHHCVAMEGLLEEGAELIESVKEPEVLDAGLIGAAQKVEHYEMAGYGTARNFARLLGFEDHAELLQETLDEEGETDQKLTDLADGMINEAAASASGSDKRAKAGSAK
ncbi:MAG: ferritin-like domain-containing protein [Chlorobia bacterium]|nr:ferritin-like domain-containing protein [Fimbriimonadaceae bacterium]